MQDVFIVMENDEYHAHSALGSSDVRRIMVSPLHFEGREEPAVRPSYFTFGSAAHCAYLEPHKFEEEYRAKPLEVDGKGPRTNHYKEWIASQPEVEWMSAEDYDKVLKVVESAVAHPITAKSFIDGHVVEGSVFFKLDGVECKARPDLVTPVGDGVVDVVDLKTTTDASPEGFRKAVGNNQLFVQEWFYREALKSAGLEVRKFIFLAVEKQAPYAAAAYTLNQEDVETARGMVKDALAAYAKAKETEVWEGYTSEVTQIDVPTWCLQRREESPSANWLSVGDAMKSFGVSRTTLYNWINKGLESKRFGGKRYVSAKAAVMFNA